MSTEPPVLFVAWERFVGWLLSRTEKFPKRVALTFRIRIDNLALDVYERLIEARYRRERSALLSRINLDLEKLRLLLRLAHDQRVLDLAAYRHACAEVDTVGRMLGGWLRQQQADAGSASLS
jgi:hypothetical protein